MSTRTGKGRPVYRRVLQELLYRLAGLCPLRPKGVLEGAEVCRVLSQYRLPVTLGRFGREGDDPLQIVHEHQLASVCLLESRHRHGFYLSIQPSALGFSRQHLAAIAETARENGHGIHFDSHSFAEANRALRLLQELSAAGFPCSGGKRSWCFSTTIPSRWRRSRQDALWAAERGMRVRLVKGDFPAAPSLEVDPAQAFLDLAQLLAGKVPELALATHDVGLARECLARCAGSGSLVRLELWFGRPVSDLLALARETCVPVGFYVPYGEGLLLQLAREILAHPHKMLRLDAFELLGGLETKLARVIRNFAP